MVSLEKVCRNMGTFSNPCSLYQGVAFLPVKDLLREFPLGGVGNIFYIISMFCFFIVLSLNIMYKPTESR